MNADKGIFTRPICQMPGCSVEVKPTEQYCAACAWIKKMALEEAEA